MLQITLEMRLFNLFKRASSQSPTAFAVNPTGEFDENDGKWSTFWLQVGNQNGGQTFKAIVSTSSFSIWLPTPKGCPLNVLQSTPYTPTTVSACAIERGVGLYDGTQSNGFLGNRSNTYLSADEMGLLDLGQDLHETTLFGSQYNTSGQIGYDIVFLQPLLAGSTSINSPNATMIYGIDDFKFFLPSIGLGVGYDLLPSPNIATGSMISNMAAAGTISSRSWGYTAGASYGMPARCL